MPPKRLPGSPTVKEKGWSPSSPRLRTPSLFWLSPAYFPSPCAKTPPALVPDPSSRIISESDPSSQPSHRHSGGLVGLQPDSFFGSSTSPPTLFITRWLRAGPHGYRRSCPRDRCSGQPTTGKKWPFYLLGGAAHTGSINKGYYWPPLILHQHLQGCSISERKCCWYGKLMEYWFLHVRFG